MNMVKRIFINKNCKILFIFFISLVFLLIIGKSFAVFSSNNSKLIANINVNDLLFNLTTNDGESDDRILHLKPGMTEEFDIVLTNLNDISTKYNLVYNVCKDIKCTNFYDNIPDDIEIYKSSETPDDLNGIIKNGFDFKKNINLVTVNNSDLDYYLKIDLNAGYEWNDLEITNLDINDFSSNSTDMEIIAFVDGIQVEKFPATCGYSANVELYSNNVKLSDTNSRVKCDGVRWLIDYADLSLNPDKIIIKSLEVATYFDDYYNCQVPYIYDNGLLLEALTAYCMYRILGRGYKHQVFDLKANNEAINPYLQWMRIKDSAKASVTNDLRHSSKDEGWNNFFYNSTFLPRRY